MGLLGESLYEERKQREGRRQLEISKSGREIGSLPEVVNPARKAACERDFRLFCESYFPETFNLAWSDDHLKVIAQIEESVLRGGLFATAMPRGAGKTSLAEAACIWATLCGHRQFIVLIGSDAKRSAGMLESIKTDFEINDLLLDDYPEAVYPIHCLEGIAHRCNGQLYQGERTHIGWTADEIVMPTISGSKASGVVMRVTSLTAGIRGMKFKRQDNKTVRPELALIDDPQTDESALSPSQCASRERILSGAVLGLAGPKKKISGIMPCTVIRRGDMADSILDREKHPEWNGTKTKMVYAFPTNQKLWDEYAEIRKESLKAERGGVEATEFYAANREAMDAGAVVAWEQRFNPDELSAIQHAMNIKIDREEAFFSEYQNEPKPLEEGFRDDLTADVIAGKINRIARGEVPTPVNCVTAFIDISKTMLWYVVCGWEDGFSGYIMDYGAYPEQDSPYFTLRDARNTLASVSQTTSVEGQIYAGLKTLCGKILGEDWRRDDGANLRVNLCLIDANWDESTETVYKFCRESEFSSILRPSRGKGIGAAMSPMRDWARRPGEKAGMNWKIGIEQERKSVRRVIYDTNFWKSFVHGRLSTAMGDRGCLSLFGDKPERHRMLADQLTSEYRVRTQGRGRECDEWRERPGVDNHYLDCLVGCAVGASIQGVALAETSAGAVAKPPRVSFADLQRRAREQRQQVRM